jgi:hypothetical protein
MDFNKLSGIVEQPAKADNAVSKINVDYKRSHSSIQAGFIIGINF